MSRLPALLLAPIALGQGRRLQRDTPRLPEAHGPRDGLVGGSASGASPGIARPLRLLVVGDSTAMGTGVATLDDGIPGRLARLLTNSVTGQRGVAWRAVGRNGATAAEVLAEFATPAVAAHFDLAVVLVGWNDALRLRPVAEFAHGLGGLLDRLHAGSPDARLVVVSAPRFGLFASMPQPLRFALGRHAAGLTHRAASVARTHGAVIAPGFDGRSLASDSFHPDGAGYQAIAEGIAAAIAEGIA